MVNIQSLVTYIVNQLVDIEASFGKTKLVKLLYLIDVEYYTITLKTLTNFHWMFYHYGPYTTEFDTLLKQIDLDIPQEDITTKAGKNAFVFHKTKYIDDEFEKSADTTQKMVVDKVIHQWGFEELNPLLSYVYFHTGPMKSAQRGELLDFSKIKRYPYIQKTSTLLASNFRDLSAEFNQMKNQFLLSPYDNLDPKPRFDNVFLAGYEVIIKDEQFYVPKGEVEISDDSKQQIQEH